MSFSNAFIKRITTNKDLPNFDKKSEVEWQVTELNGDETRQ